MVVAMEERIKLGVSACLRAKMSVTTVDTDEIRSSLTACPNMLD